MIANTTACGFKLVEVDSLRMKKKAILMIENESEAAARIEVEKAGSTIIDQFGKSVDTAKQLDDFLSNSNTLAIPRALVSILGGNWIVAKQIENVIQTQKRLHEFAEQEGVSLNPSDLPWKIKIETVRAVSDEDDESLQGLWARLLLTGMRDDDERKDIDRIIVDAVKRLTPQTAQLLGYIHGQFKVERQLYRSEIVRGFAQAHDYSKVDVAMYMDHLSQIRCVQHTVSEKKNEHRTRMTTLGRAIIQTSFSKKIHNSSD